MCPWSQQTSAVLCCSSGSDAHKRTCACDSGTHESTDPDRYAHTHALAKAECCWRFKSSCQAQPSATHSAAHNPHSRANCCCQILINFKCFTAAVCTLLSIPLGGSCANCPIGCLPGDTCTDGICGAHYLQRPPQHATRMGRPRWQPLMVMLACAPCAMQRGYTVVTALLLCHLIFVLSIVNLLAGAVGC
jgi:hypothetical protein